jgi:hypothetical protein
MEKQPLAVPQERGLFEHGACPWRRKALPFFRTFHELATRLLTLLRLARAVPAVARRTIVPTQCRGSVCDVSVAHRRPPNYDDATTHSLWLAYAIAKPRALVPEARGLRLGGSVGIRLG